MTASRRTLLAAGLATSLIPSALPAASADDPWSEADRIADGIARPRIARRRVRVAGPADGDSRQAIQDAIDATSRAGGGRVELGRGEWRSLGPLRLKTGVELHLARGCVLTFSPAPDDYLPLVRGRWEGAELFNYAPLIGAENATDIAITGAGIIDGGADAGLWDWEALAAPAAARLKRLAYDNAPLSERQFGPGHFLRPSAMAFVDVQRLRLNRFTLRNTAFWMIQLVFVDQAVLERLTVASRQQHNDAVDLDSSRNVLVQNCRMITGNYSVALKSGRDLEGRAVNRPTERIVVRRNAFASADGIGFGSEMSGGIRQIYVSDNVMADVGAAFNFKSTLDRGGFIEDVNVRDMVIGRSDTLIKMGVGGPGDFGGDVPARVERISFSNVRAGPTGMKLDINGPAALPISDLRLSDVTVESAERPDRLIGIA